MEPEIQNLPRSEYCSGKEIVESIFSKKRRRSSHVIIVANNAEKLEEWRYAISASVGAKTSMAVVDTLTNLKSLSRAVRELTPNLLNDTCVLCILGKEDIVTIDFARKLSAALRAGLLYMPKADSRQLEEQCKALRDNLPDPTIPIWGVRPPTNLDRDIDPKLKAEFRDNLAVSQCARELTIAFQVMHARKQTFGRASSDTRDVTVNLIGYTPSLVQATLRSGGRPHFFDPAFRDFKSMICPSIRNLESIHAVQRKKDVGWIRTNPQKKIAITAYLGYSMAAQILYIGCYPGTNLHDLSLVGHKVIYIDPLINSQFILIQSLICPDSTYKAEKYRFTNEHFISLISGRFDIMKPIVVINDAWIDGLEYEKFQRDAFDHFSDIVSQYEHVQVISKFHLKHQFDLHKVAALLPQPYGGSSDEMRIIFNSTGVDYTFDPFKVGKYMSEFHDLSIAAQLWCVNFYYHFITTRKDILKCDPGSNKIYSGLFSLSNQMNKKKDVLNWIQRAHNQSNIVSFTTPNEYRVKFMKTTRFDPKTNISINGDIFAFQSPAKDRTWYDRCYTPVELGEAGLECITLEALSGIMGSRYKGVGCYTQSAAFDTYDVYMSQYAIVESTQVQHVGTSPLGFVKSFTHLFLKDGGMRRQSYYSNRAFLLQEYLTKMKVPRSAYRIVGNESATIYTLDKILVSTRFGNVRLLPGMEVNLSGHMLSMIVAAHFVSIPFEMWIRQLVAMATDVPEKEILAQVHSPIELFDNISKDGMYLHWHTLNELMLTAEIALPYVTSVMMGMQSDDLINLHLKHFQNILTAETMSGF
uniref:Putative minor core protein n=1 Tax=Atrato Reo-like virus TaxID=2689356 RepID=A0A6B9KU47_9REOV|nr:putative minor core protein [Atrato Reo-like virus]